MPGRSAYQLEIENLFFQYPDYPGLENRPLFRGLSLEVAEDETVLVLGKPDSGKTTLARILSGLIPRFSGGSLSGSIRLGGRDISESHPFDLLSEIGLVFQNQDEQLLTTRCDLEVSFALESLGLDRKEIGERIRRSLERMELEGFESRRPESLSGGEKKKLLIACLLAVDPAIWLLDETLEELDETSKRNLLDHLKGERKSAVIFSAKWHDFFSNYASRVFLLDGGLIHPLEEPPGSKGFMSRLSESGLILQPGPEQEEQQGNTGVRLRRRLGDLSPLLRAENLRFSYQDGGGFRLEVDRLSISSGERVGLVGRNGSGKSTLARLLCGLQAPREGRIEIRSNGQSREAGPEVLNRFTGYMFQNPDLQIFLPSVREELAYGLRLLGLTQREIERRVQQAIERFRLPGADTPPALMSYGARKRLQAAVYYLLERPLLILDEGDSGLSAPDFTLLVEELAGAERGLLIITHDLELAGRLTDRRIRLEGGSLAP